MTVPIIPGRSQRDLVLNLKEKREGNAFVEAARDLDKLSRGADATGDKFADLTSDTKKLEAEIARAKGRIQDLGVQFARTQDMSLFGDIRKERNLVAQLEKIAKEISGEGDGLGVTIGSAIGTHAGKGMSSGIGDALGALPSKLKGTAIVAGVGLGVALAPALGAAVAGAVTGVVGLGGIAGGIAAASKDPRVRSAAQEFSSSISTMFFSSGEVFVEPTRQALESLRDDFASLNLREAFAKGAPAVEIFADGVGDLAKNIMPGFNRAMDRAPETAEVFRDGLGELGHAISDLLTDLANSEGTLDGLRMTFFAIADTLRMVGNTAKFLGDRYHDLVSFSAAASGVAEDFPIVGWMFSEVNDRAEQLLGTGPQMQAWAIGTGTAAKSAGLGMADLSEATLEAAKSYEVLVHEADLYYQFVTGKRDADIAIEQGMDDLAESVMENGRSLDIATEAGRRNVGILADMEAAAKRNYDINVKNGMNTATAAKLYDESIAKIKGRAEALGYEKKRVDELLGSWRSLASMSNIQLRAHFEASGTMLGEHSGLRGNERRAGGGPVMAGRGYTVGEQGIELFVPEQNGTIIPNHQLRAMAGGGASTVAAPAPMALTVMPGGSGMFESFMVEFIKRYVSVYGGGSVQTAFGRSN